jgi:hypothetical protein
MKKALTRLSIFYAILLPLALQSKAQDTAYKIRSKDTTSVIKIKAHKIIDQNPREANYYTPIKLTGRLILKTLIDRTKDKPYKTKSLVFVLTNKVKFIGATEDEITTTTNLIRVYHDGEKKYTALLNKLLTIDTKVSGAASLHYPLDVNIMDDAPFKIIDL